MSLVASTAQPKGVYAVFILQLLAMVGFSMVFSLIVLYCSNQLGLSDHTAYAITAAFNALAFVTSLPAAWIAEKYTGFFKSSIISVLLMALGLFLISIKTTSALYLGLGFFIVGTGMSVPCLFVLLGNLYTKDHPARENGFVLSYIGMNMGSFIASSIAGYVATGVGYDWAFSIGAVVSLLMLPIFFKYKSVLKEDKVFTPKEQGIGMLYLIALIMGSIILIFYSEVCNILMLITGILAVIYVVTVAQKQSPQAKKGLIIFVSLTVISVVFWTLYALTPSLLTVFTERNVDRHLLGHLIPAADFSALNPFFIITLGPLVTVLLSKAKKKGYSLSTAAKFGLGTVLMGAGFLVLALGVDTANSAGISGMVWIVASYFLQTLGEVFVGPIGYAMVGEFVPKAKIGVMMGIWQLSAGIAGALSEYLADYAAPSGQVNNPLLSNIQYHHAFWFFGLVTVVVGLATIAIKRFLTLNRLNSKSIDSKDITLIDHESIVV